MVPEKALKELKRIYGNRLKKDLPHKIAYGFDATRIETEPDVVVFPLNEKEIIKTVQLANEYRFPIVPRGSGTGFSGGAVPAEGGVVLSLTKMIQLEIKQEEMLAIAEPGVITADLQREAEKKGLFYPPDPASLKNSTIGGNIAENSGGPRCLKYGVTRNYVLGLEVILPTGEKISPGRGLQKNVAGYDLLSLFVGSEGTLGIVTRAYLKLIPKPAITRSMRADFPTVRDASEAATDILYSGILPAALEFMDQKSIEAASRYLGVEITAGSSLLIQVDGDEASVSAQIKQVKNVLNHHRPINIVISSNQEEEEAVWNLRRSISPAIASLKPIKINEDIVVPRSKIPDAVDFTYAIAEKYSLQVIVFGHMGDGNIHVNFMIDESERERAEQAVYELFQRVVETGGAISGEHGIGITKSKFLALQLGDTEIEVMKRIKRLFDPNNIMNPGKIFPPRLTK